MKSKLLTLSRIPSYIALVALAAVALFLLRYSHFTKHFTEAQLIRDLMWMDAWSLLVLLAAALVVFSDLTRRMKTYLLLGCFSVYGLITISLIFNGTPFSYNAYWGDQRFRQAMILKFASFALPGDYYYKDLPLFYPPLYFYLLSLYARLFSVEAFKMLKIGSQLLYLFGPVLVYLFWTKLVGRFRAIFVAVACFLFASQASPEVIASPHGLLGNTLFVPWWLLYVEHVKPIGTNWKFLVIGGLIGGLIFMTYPYAFFIGGLLMVLRSTVMRRCSWVRLPESFSAKKAWLVLAAAAVFSAPYWLPAMISIFVHGGKPVDQEWFTIGRTGLTFRFVEFTIPGVLFLAGICYALYRRTVRINRMLLILTGSALAFYLLGTLAGNFGFPVNVMKAREFLGTLAGPFAGLAVAALVRRGWYRKRFRYVVTTLVLAVLLVGMHNFNSFSRHEYVRTARATSARPFASNTYTPDFAGKVFLCGNASLPSFWPVCSFIASNQHYSHPASRFAQRYEFLCLLQEISDPYLFNVALRHNTFDCVDDFFPLNQNGKFEIPLELSNYPNGNIVRRLTFDTSVVADTQLFTPQADSGIFGLGEAQPRPAGFHVSSDEIAPLDSLRIRLRMRMVRDYLLVEGQQLYDSYLDTDWDGWHELNVEPQSTSSPIRMNKCFAVETADSVFFLMAFTPERDIDREYKVFLHVTPAGDNLPKQNYDFAPDIPTTQWLSKNVVLVGRSIAAPDGDITFEFGFFRGNERLRCSYTGRWSAPVAN
jgi:hypothetical protein